MTRKMKMGTREASRAAAKIGTISLRRGYAKSVYTISPSWKVMGKLLLGAGLAM